MGWMPLGTPVVRLFSAIHSFTLTFVQHYLQSQASVGPGAYSRMSAWSSNIGIRSRLVQRAGKGTEDRRQEKESFKILSSAVLPYSGE